VKLCSGAVVVVRDTLLQALGSSVEFFVILHSLVAQNN
jgi:hypothetical protein